MVPYDQAARILQAAIGWFLPPTKVQASPKVTSKAFFDVAIGGKATGRWLGSTELFKASVREKDRDRIGSKLNLSFG